MSKESVQQTANLRAILIFVLSNLEKRGCDSSSLETEIKNTKLLDSVANTKNNIGNPNATIEYDIKTHASQYKMNNSRSQVHLMDNKLSIENFFQLDLSLFFAKTKA